MWKKIIFVALATLSMCSINAQTVKTYSDRYDKLVSLFGPAGVGIETVLNDWEKLDSADVKLIKARYSYYLTKGRKTQVVRNSNPKYLGLKPLLSLKDSLNQEVYYFEEPVYDEENLMYALKALDRGIKYYPENLDFRFGRTALLLDYEKESPDMVLQDLLAIVDYNEQNSYDWVMEGIDNPDKEFVNEALQEYCYKFYSIGSSSSLEAFKTLSEMVLKYEPKNPVFLGNLGSYYQHAGNIKKALKYYKKVLKIDESNYAVIRNTVAIAISMKDKKLQKQVLPLLAKYGNEQDKIMAEGRLSLL